MDVELVAPRFFPHVGGIEESVAQLARGLLARGHRVRVHTTHTEGLSATESWQGIEIRRYPRTLSRGYYVSRFEPQLQGDVIHLHAYAHHTNDWVIRRHAGHTRIVLSTHHGARFPKRNPVNWLYHQAYNAFRGLPDLRRLDGVLCPTAWDAEYFAGRGVEPEKVYVVPTGADERAFQPQTPWAPPGTQAGRFLLYLGRIHPEKGLVELVRAYRRTRLQSPLVIAGRDEGLAPRLTDLATGDARIHVLTELSEDQRWGLLAGCRGLVLPSRHEGQGIVVAEAWAQGKPVVATRAGALPTVIEDESDGLLVPRRNEAALADALVRVAQDDSLARRLGQRGRAKAERRYRWSRILTRVEAIYEGRPPEMFDDSSAWPGQRPKA